MCRNSNAGIVGGLQSGVAKNAFIHPVRALGCDGSGGYGTVMAALDWIGWNAIYPAVISMSLASPASISIDQAVQQLVLFSGITTVIVSFICFLVVYILLVRERHDMTRH